MACISKENTFSGRKAKKSAKFLQKISILIFRQSAYNNLSTLVMHPEAVLNTEHFRKVQHPEAAIYADHFRSKAASTIPESPEKGRRDKIEGGITK